MNADEHAALNRESGEGTDDPMVAMAREAMLRTGPNELTFDEIAHRLGRRDQGTAHHELTVVPDDLIIIGPAENAIPTTPMTTETGDRELLNRVIGAVTALHLELRARPGGVYLPAAARTIDVLDPRQREIAWTLTLGTFRHTIPPHIGLDWISAHNVALPHATIRQIKALFPETPVFGLASDGRSHVGEDVGPGTPGHGARTETPSLSDSIYQALSGGSAQAANAPGTDPQGGGPAQAAYSTSDTFDAEYAATVEEFPEITRNDLWTVWGGRSAENPEARVFVAQSGALGGLRGQYDAHAPRAGGSAIRGDGGPPRGPRGTGTCRAGPARWPPPGR